jgi:hypothetical protein
VFFVSFFLINNKINSQTPDFKFHLAFEDATGAKDTIWVIWDSLATNGYDPIFNETPQSLPTNNFRVYMYYNATDSGKVKALGYNYNGVNFHIHAKDYVYPITMTWDTSIMYNNNLPFQIREAILDNEWFFLNNNWPPYHAYNMLTSDSIELPTFTWGSQDHFPIYFYMGYTIFTGNKEIENTESKITVFPNPTNDKLEIVLENSTVNLVQFKIVDINGKVVKQLSHFLDKTIIDVCDFQKGVYFIEIISNKRMKIVEKFVVNH